MITDNSISLIHFDSQHCIPPDVFLINWKELNHSELTQHGHFICTFSIGIEYARIHHIQMWSLTILSWVMNIENHMNENRHLILLYISNCFKVDDILCICLIFMRVEKHLIYFFVSIQDLKKKTTQTFPVIMYWWCNNIENILPSFQTNQFD